MLEDGEIVFLNGPLGEAFISDHFFSIWLFLYLYLQAAYLSCAILGSIISAKSRKL